MSSFYLICKMAILEHVLYIFSARGHWFELISFVLCQATQGTSLEYPQVPFWREKNSTFFYTLPLLSRVEKHFTEEKKYFPMVLICQVTGWETCWTNSRHKYANETPSGLIVIFFFCNLLHTLPTSFSGLFLSAFYHVSLIWVNQLFIIMSLSTKKLYESFSDIQGY